LDKQSDGPALRRLVRQAIDDLPETYRIVLWLRDVEGLDRETTGQILDLNPALIRTRLHRARQALHALLDVPCRGEAS
jgi:RNA polymerase sigma-70 factor (ECF subfamily)